MKTIITLLTIIILVASCSTSRRYTYDIKMQKPVAADRLYFENDTFSISFTFKPNYAEFELYNKLQEGIRINWDEVSTSINGDAKRIVHYKTGADRITETQPPTTIPPSSKLIDAFITTDMAIRYRNVGGNRIPIYTNLYPTLDYGNKNKRKEILALKGQKQIIFLPYYIRNVFYSKTFEFIVADVKEKK